MHNVTLLPHCGNCRLGQPVFTLLFLRKSRLLAPHFSPVSRIRAPGIVRISACSWGGNAAIISVIVLIFILPFCRMMRELPIGHGHLRRIPEVEIARQEHAPELYSPDALPPFINLRRDAILG